MITWTQLHSTSHNHSILNPKHKVVIESITAKFHIEKLVINFIECFRIVEIDSIHLLIPSLHRLYVLIVALNNFASEKLPVVS